MDPPRSLRVWVRFDALQRTRADRTPRCHRHALGARDPLDLEPGFKLYPHSHPAEWGKTERGRSWY